MLRVGVIEQLGEGGQRLLLDRLAALLGSTPLGQYTPVGVAALEAMALLLEVLGEVSSEKRAELEPAIGAKLAGPHACLRLQAAAAVAALAVAEPASAARLVSASLANLHAALEKLIAATASAPPDRSRPSVPGTPRGVGSVKLKPDMNAGRRRRAYLASGLHPPGGCGVCERCTKQDVLRIHPALPGPPCILLQGLIMTISPPP